MTIGILGAGTMGKGIARAFAQKGHFVKLYDPYEEARQKASQELSAAQPTWFYLRSDSRGGSRSRTRRFLSKESGFSRDIPLYTGPNPCGYEYFGSFGSGLG